MTFFSNIAAALESEARKVEADLAPLWAKIKPLVQATEQDLASVALNAVIAQIPAVAAGTEKFTAATAQVLTALGNEGKTAGINLIEASVQLAYNFVQSLRPAQ